MMIDITGIKIVSGPYRCDVLRLFTDAILNILSKNKKYLKIKHKNKIPPDLEAGGEFVD
ncbi:hypothetical protein [Escherichia coli]|uniref:hypothetical protein n=1 Tax=Escherichia coli TaxID=562 RepID=UPI001F0DD7FC|nr:hypothetical protein [Escherichia coli]